MEQTSHDAAHTADAARAASDEARAAQEDRTQLPEPGQEVAQEPPLVTEGDFGRDDLRGPAAERAPR